MNILTLAFTVIGLAAPISAASASTIYATDFQDSSYSEWSLSGQGSDAANTYNGNVSLRLDGLRQAQLALSTSGYENVSLTMDLAAVDLVAGDFCHAEYSTDGGQSWATVTTLGNGDDDGSFTGGSVTTGLDDKTSVILRFRAYTLFNNYCYGDNVEISGDAQSETPIFTDDFQSGDYPTWSLGGQGNDQINSYQGNNSLRLDGLRQATQVIDTQGYVGVELSMDLAALYLEPGDNCIAEYSTDGGQSWQQLQSLGSGDADGEFRTQTQATGLDNNPGLQIRYRAYTLYGNYCYGDNVVVTAAATEGGELPVLELTGGSTFPDTLVGESAVQSYTLSNQGNSELNISQVSAGAGNVFVLQNDSCSGQLITPSASCQFNVEFIPDSASVFTTELTINSDDPQSPEQRELSGIGLVENGEPGCEYDCLPGDGVVNRTQLTAAQLTSSQTPQLLDYSHYALPANAANPQNQFAGTLTLTIAPGVLSEQGTSLRGSYTDPDRLPDFSFEFVQKGTHLIPLQRQLIETGHPAWDYLLMPGRVWQEAGDEGFSRVALPFALQEVNANCVHNGVMTFLFKDDGSISDVAYQIAQETCQYFKYNLHGQLAADYQPHSVAGANEITQTYLSEMASRIPVKPLAELASDYPSATINLANIGSDQSAVHRSAFGVYYQGIHYQGACTTRQGAYPFCTEMALPSYSTAKSVVGGYGLMRLEQAYGGSPKNLTISDYVPECTGTQWDDVTLSQALNMVTGNYDSAGDSVDEGAARTVNDFFLVATHADKIAHACSYTRKSVPGSTFVYHSSDTYLLSAAMQAFYRQQEGSQADYYRDMLVKEIWQPLDLSPLSAATRRTYDSVDLPWAGFGLSLLSDDFIKLGRFASIEEGVIDGEQILQPMMLADAMQRGTDGGVSTGTASSRYRHGFWAYDLGASNVLNCGASSWVPYMSGFGGIGVVMLPNDMVYYYVSDNDEYGFTETLSELDKISPVCQ